MSETRRVRAAVVTALDGPDAIEIREVESRPPGPGEVRVRVGASGVNFPDLLMTRGLYQHKAEAPFIPGMECAGTILDLGEGVTGWKPGDRVVARVSAHGDGFIEETTVAAGSLLPTPESMNDAEAASLFIGHYTAWNGAIDRGQLKPGETMVVLGAAGGVGLATVQIGKAHGATVIAAASSPEKRAVLEEEGADHVLDPADPDLKGKVMALTGGEGADLVYDIVGGDLFTTGLRLLRPEGRLAVIGFASGAITSAPANIVLIKEISVVGVRAGMYSNRHPDRMRAAWDQIAEWSAEGKVKPRIWKTFPLEKSADALKALENRSVIGKVAVTMD